MTPFKTICPNLSLGTQLTPFKNMTWFLYYVTNWLLSRPSDPILSLCTPLTPFKTLWANFICTQLTPFKTIWPNFIIVYPNDSFQDHMNWFLFCPPYWLLSRPFDPILSLCTQLTPFKTIWGKEVKWSWKDSIGYTMIKLGQMVLKGVNWVHNDKLDQMVLKGVIWVHNY